MGKFLLSLIVVIGGILGYQWYASAHTAKIEYTTGKIKRQDVTDPVSVTGAAEAIEVQVVNAEVTGVVEEILVDYNDVVQKGQELARLSSDVQRVQMMEAEAKLQTVEASVSKAEAAIAASKAGLQAAEAAFQKATAGLEAAQNLLDSATRERDTTLESVNKQIVPKSKLDLAEDNVKRVQSLLEASRSDVKQAEAGRLSAASLAKQAEAGKHEALSAIKAANLGLQVAQLNLEKTVLRSQMNGIVLNRSTQVGETVGRPKISLHESFGGMFEIAAPLDKMRAVVNVSEADYARVKVGQAVVFTIDAYPDAKFHAKVTQIRNTPTGDRTAVSYATVLEFDNRKDESSGEWMVKPRATVSADIIVRKASDVLVVPNAALLFTPTDFNIVIPVTKDNERIVWTVGHESRPTPHKVSVGITDGFMTEVVAGELKEGQELITGQPTKPSSSGFKLPISN